MLPSFARLRKARDFRAVFAARGNAGSGASGQSGRPGMPPRPRAWVLSTSAIVLHASPRRAHAKPASSAPIRLGFNISKKVSKRSHDRNRLKRRLSEIARKEVLNHYAGQTRYDCVVVVRQGAVNADSALLRRDLLSLLRRAGMHMHAPPAPPLPAQAPDGER